MAITIVRYQPEHEAAVAAFNQRGKEHSAPFSLSKTPVASWLPKKEDRSLYREFFLALDAGEVRGGYTLRHQDFWVNGTLRRMANYQGPLSEGLWERRYMMAGVQMLRNALREQPLLYALGMGGLAQPLPKLLASAGWTLAPVPFFFKVLRPSRFLREIQPLRKTKARALACNVAAFSGAGFIAVHLFQRWKTKHRLSSDYRAERVREYGDWADTIWDRAKDKYGFSAVRDRVTQNILFGDGNEKNITLHCTRGGSSVGWAVVRSTQMKDDHYFGNARLGSLVDVLALPGEEFAVVALATDYLRGVGSDLVVTNQSHARWTTALRESGYLSGPSNFIFAGSPALMAELQGDSFLSQIHFNRADGDGPIHL